MLEDVEYDKSESDAQTIAKVDLGEPEFKETHTISFQLFYALHVMLRSCVGIATACVKRT